MIFCEKIIILSKTYCQIFNALASFKNNTLAGDSTNFCNWYSCINSIAEPERISMLKHELQRNHRTLVSQFQIGIPDKSIIKNTALNCYLLTNEINQQFTLFFINGLNQTLESTLQEDISEWIEHSEKISDKATNDAIPSDMFEIAAYQLKQIFYNLDYTLGAGLQLATNSKK